MNDIVHKLIIVRHKSVICPAVIPVRSYLCNWAVKVTESKVSWAWKNVTCKNCLKRRKK